MDHHVHDGVGLQADCLHEVVEDLHDFDRQGVDIGSGVEVEVVFEGGLSPPEAGGGEDDVAFDCAHFGYQPFFSRLFLDPDRYSGVVDSFVVTVPLLFCF